MRAVHTWYVRSTYPGHSYAPGYSLQRHSHCNVAVSAAISPCLPRMYQRNLQHIPLYGRVLVQYRLVLLCTGTYRYRPPCNAVHYPSKFGFSIWYTVHTVINAHWSALIAVCTVYLIENPNPLDSELHYKVVGTGI
jgi:hypothetical protein